MKVSHGLCLLVSVIATACSESAETIDPDPGIDREVTVEAALDVAHHPRVCSLIVTRLGEGDGTVTSTPRGISCGRDCSQVFACGTRVHLTAVPYRSTFAGWSGACTGTDPCTVTLVEASTRVNAAFTVCGNGVVEPGEQCDDGNRRDGDGCDRTCRLPQCGNGLLDPGEQCDDGNPVGGDGCSAQCQLEICGNGVLDLGEQCDDGNQIAGDGCSAACRLEVCGNGFLDPGEQCDFFGQTAFCDSDCTFPVCGDGLVNPAAGEQCDDGNAVNGDGCSAQCQLELCGNGVVDPGEQCDAAGESAACDRDCTLAVCGDALLNLAAGEQCDDGPFNGSPGDRCSATCTLVQ